MTRWIPVTERLPEPGVRALLWLPNEGATFGWYKPEDGFMFPVWFLDGSRWREANDVTHWQPAPAPPGAEGSEPR